MPQSGFLKPRIVDVQNLSPNHARVTMEPFEQTVDVAHLLLLAQLLAVVGESRAALLAVLAGRVGAPLHRALVGKALLALEKELLPFSPAMPALVQVSSH